MAIEVGVIRAGLFPFVRGRPLRGGSAQVDGISLATARFTESRSAFSAAAFARIALNRTSSAARFAIRSRSIDARYALSVELSSRPNAGIGLGGWRSHARRRSAAGISKKSGRSKPSAWSSACRLAWVVISARDIGESLGGGLPKRRRQHWSECCRLCFSRLVISRCVQFDAGFWQRRRRAFHARIDNFGACAVLHGFPLTPRELLVNLGSRCCEYFGRGRYRNENRINDRCCCGAHLDTSGWLCTRRYAVNFSF